MDSVAGTAAIRIVVTTFSLLLSWRLWMFTIRPQWYPNEPKQYPYWIPFIGHVTGFFVDFNAAIEKGRKYFGPSREPFAMTVAGETIYVATSPEDIGGVWKNSKTISLNPITMNMYAMGGLSEKSRKSMFEQHPTARYNADNARPLTPTQMTIELHHRQLFAGPRLDSLVKDRMLPMIFKKLDIADAGNQAVLSRSGDSAIVSLRQLCVDTFITEATEAFYGPALLKRSPNLIGGFLDWEYNNWKFLFMIPNAFAQDMLKSKKTIIDAFADYYRQPRSERPGAIYFVHGLEDMLRDAGLTDDEMGMLTLLHYWALVGNLYKFTFWLVSHLVHNAVLLEQVREEVLPAVRGEEVDEKYLIEKCPKLNALVSETLRLTVTSSLARVIVEPTMVGGKMLKPGNKIMLPIRELHYNSEIWGKSTERLEPRRFVDNPKLSKSLSYRPWGGGHTLCPGRFLALRIANGFLAALLSQYDITVESNAFPKGDGGRPSPGITTLSRDADLKLRFSPRG